MAVINISILICPTWISLWKIWEIGTRIRIRIHFGTGSGSTFSKCGSEDPDPLLRKGGSEDPDPDPLFPDPDPRQNEMDPKRCLYHININLRLIRNTYIVKKFLFIALSFGNYYMPALIVRPSIYHGFLICYISRQNVPHCVFWFYISQARHDEADYLMDILLRW